MQYTIWRGGLAVLLTVLMVLPAIPASPGGDRAVPDITFHVTTLSTGNPSETATFEMAGTDSSIALNLPNGATILSAKLNVTGLPLIEGGRDCPQNITIDVDKVTPPEWSFNGIGYGQMGLQTTFKNNLPYMNASIPGTGGTTTSVALRLPGNAQL